MKMHHCVVITSVAFENWRRRSVVEKTSLFHSLKIYSVKWKKKEEKITLGLLQKIRCYSEAESELILLLSEKFCHLWRKCFPPPSLWMISLSSSASSNKGQPWPDFFVVWDLTSIFGSVECLWYLSTVVHVL